MTDTPRTDWEAFSDGIEVNDHLWVSVDFARQLERELAVAISYLEDADGGIYADMTAAEGVRVLREMRRAYEEGNE